MPGPSSGRTLILAAILAGVTKSAVWTSPEPLHVSAEGLRPLRLLDTFAPPNVTIKSVTVQGDRAYAVAAYGGFYVLDLSDRDRLRLLGQCDTPGNATEVVIRGHLAHVADRPTGVQIVDVSDPSAPRIVGLYDSVELATGLDVAGDLLAVCNRSSGIEFADLTGPRHPRSLSALRLGEAQGIRLRGTVAYVGLWHNRKLAVVDIADPCRPVVIGEAPLGGYGWGVALSGDLAYCATGHHAPGDEGGNRGHGCDVVDISDPRSPHSVARVNTPPFYRVGNDWWWVAASGSHAVHADGENGAFLLDVSDPLHPRPIAHAASGDFSGAAALAEDRILVADMKAGLRLFEAEGVAAPAVEPEVPGPALPQALPPVVAGSGYELLRTSGQARSVAIAGDRALVASGTGGIDVFSLEPEVRRVATVAAPGVARDVRVANGRAYVALGVAGLGLMDLSAGDELRMQGRLEGAVADYVEPVGKCVVVMRGEGGMDLVDAGDVAQLRRIAGGSIPHFPVQLAALGDRYVLGVSPWQIAALQATPEGRLAKTVLAGAEDRQGGGGLAVCGSRALVCRLSALECWAMEAPLSPRVLSSVALPYRACGVVAWDGSRAVVTNRVSGAVTFAQTAEDGAIQVVRTVALPGYPGRAALHGDMVLIPCGHEGLAVVRWDDVGLWR